MIILWQVLLLLGGFARRVLRRVERIDVLRHSPPEARTRPRVLAHGTAAGESTESRAKKGNVRGWIEEEEERARMIERASEGARKRETETEIEIEGGGERSLFTAEALRLPHKQSVTAERSGAEILNAVLYCRG